MIFKVTLVHIKSVCILKRKGIYLCKQGSSTSREFYCFKKFKKIVSGGLHKTIAGFEICAVF